MLLESAKVTPSKVENVTGPLKDMPALVAVIVVVGVELSTMHGPMTSSPATVRDPGLMNVDVVAERRRRSVRAALDESLSTTDDASATIEVV